MHIFPHRTFWKKTTPVYKWVLTAGILSSINYPFSNLCTIYTSTLYRPNQHPMQTQPPPYTDPNNTTCRLGKHYTLHVYYMDSDNTLNWLNQHHIHIQKTLYNYNTGCNTTEKTCQKVKLLLWICSFMNVYIKLIELSINFSLIV